VERVWKKD
jgi:hypothetical protein